MRCNGIPTANDLGNLRKYIHMWQLEIDQFNKNEHNWLLTTDERTILTQDREIANVTRIHLQKQQPILGDLYAKRARDVLGVSFLENIAFHLHSRIEYVFGFHRF